MDRQSLKLRTHISYLVWFFMVSLIASGITAIPVRAGVVFLLDVIPMSWTGVYEFLMYIKTALFSCDQILFYGYDWLAFAHIIIALLFIGVLRDPVRNIWVVEFAMMACMLIIPFAFIMGAVRGIPVWWRLVDCSFGVFGMIPLWLVRMKIIALQKVIEVEKLNTVF